MLFILAKEELVGKKYQDSSISSGLAQILDQLWYFLEWGHWVGIGGQTSGGKGRETPFASEGLRQGFGFFVLMVSYFLYSGTDLLAFLKWESLIHVTTMSSCP